MMAQNTFLFLYPVPEYIDHLIDTCNPIPFITPDLRKLWEDRQGRAKSEEEVEWLQEQARRESRAIARVFYGERINECIEKRYREKGYVVSFLSFKDHPLSKLIKPKPKDLVLYADITLEQHTTMDENNQFPYANEDKILDQIGNPSHLRIAGYHMWDCVQRMAKAAHERGIDTLVDEDLTEFFFYQMIQDELDVSKFDPRLPERGLQDTYKAAREDKPWLWIEYFGSDV